MVDLIVYAALVLRISEPTHSLSQYNNQGVSFSSRTFDLACPDLAPPLLWDPKTMYHLGARIHPCKWAFFGGESYLSMSYVAVVACEQLVLSSLFARGSSDAATGYQSIL